MTQIDWEQLAKDRATGTPGPWHHCHINGWGVPDEVRMVAARNHEAKAIAGDCPIAVAKDGAVHWETKWPAKINARRIARVPDLEAYALTAKRQLEAAEALAKAVKTGCDYASDASKGYLWHESKKDGFAALVQMDMRTGEEDFARFKDALAAFEAAKGGEE